MLSEKVDQNKPCLKLVKKLDRHRKSKKVLRFVEDHNKSDTISKKLLIRSLESSIEIPYFEYAHRLRTTLLTVLRC